MNLAYQSNISTAAYRADNPRAQTLMSRAEERAYLEYRTAALKDVGMEWTKGYKAMAARLAEMEGGAAQ
jgi:hypothetical protein